MSVSAENGCFFEIKAPTFRQAFAVIKIASLSLLMFIKVMYNIM
jgi:hypothetical protein